MKNSFKTLVIAGLAITVSVTSLPQPAAARSILDVLFGNKDEEPKGPPPEVTLQAPFPTTPTAGTSNSQLMQIYDAPTDDASAKTGTSLDQPHRSPDQISEWTAGIVSQAMTISPATYTEDLKKISVEFTPYALQEYQTYLQGVNLMNILTSNNMRLQAISDGPGLITKEGAISGTYHWLVQIPLMTSFYGADMKEVDKSTNFQSQNLQVLVQVGREAPKSSGDIGLVIERWHVTAASK